MCLEGGCGACIVTAKRKDAATGKDWIFAVNSVRFLNVFLVLQGNDPLLHKSGEREVEEKE